MVNLLKEKTQRISRLEYFFSKKVGKAIAAYNMIEDNDKVLVGISGGKDSMSLLKVLRYKQKRFPIHFDITACYVDMGLDGYRRRALEAYLKENGYNYTLEGSRLWQSKIEENRRRHSHPAGKGGVACFWCAFNRRKKLFQTAERLGCNKIALGHHKDDIAETFLLNLFFHGEISTMLPSQPFFKGKFHIIRPLALCEERFIIRYAKASDFPEIKSRCPNSGTSKRMLMKNILNMVSEFNKDVKTNIFRSMERINHEYLPRPFYTDKNKIEA